MLFSMDQAALIRTAPLIRTALAARTAAYAPYSNYPVGAAILTELGIYSGCNIENASYGLSNCAERTAIFTAVAAGARKITAAAIVTENGGSPCGACRQVLAEFAQPDCIVLLLDASGGVITETTIGELLPLAFRL
jgi:cytidine deaminase